MIDHEIVDRYLLNPIMQDIKRKMVFIAGPRQVGKTTLAHSLAQKFTSHSIQYLNWDFHTDRLQILKEEFSEEAQLLILDEIHKYNRWKNLLKGWYDKFKNEKKFLVTGSARLNHYRKGGDSLQGRYHFHRLHPFSLNEINAHPNKNDLEALLKYGGFPEPFLANSETFSRRWKKEVLERVIREDIRDLSQIKEIGLMQLLAETLPEKVGSPLSINSLSEDLQINHQTVNRWISILEELYLVFRISPFGSPKIRAVKKEQKLYFWDWSQISSKGTRFENFIACHLLKYCHFLEDTKGYKMELRYIRDVYKKEIDFVVLKDKKPIFALECKSLSETIHKHIFYFKERTKIPKFYQTHMGKKDFIKDGIRVAPFTALSKELGLL